MRRRDEQFMAALCHACNAVPLWGLIFCGWVWYENREKSLYLRAQSRQAAYFHAALLAAGVVWMTVALVTALLGYLFKPLGLLLGFINGLIMLCVFVLYVSICLWGAWRCWEGEPFRYPLIGERAD